MVPNFTSPFYNLPRERERPPKAPVSTEKRITRKIPLSSTQSNLFCLGFLLLLQSKNPFLASSSKLLTSTLLLSLRRISLILLSLCTKSLSGYLQNAVISTIFWFLLALLHLFFCGSQML